MNDAIDPRRLRHIDAAKRHNKNAGARGLAALVQNDELFFCPCDREGAPKKGLGYQILQGPPTPPDADPAFGCALELWRWSSWDEARYAERRVTRP